LGDYAKFQMDSKACFKATKLVDKFHPFALATFAEQQHESLLGDLVAAVKNNEKGFCGNVFLDSNVYLATNLIQSAAQQQHIARRHFHNIAKEREKMLLWFRM